MEFDVINILLYVGVILLATKAFGMLTRRIGLPQVAGMILAGLLIGPALFGGHGIITPNAAETDVIKSLAQIGVVFILFSSGLETDFNELRRSGLKSTLIALCGVLAPLALGTVLALMFFGGFSAAKDSNLLLNALFVGSILTATSVGITVETLRELGKLNTAVGTTVLSAAIIDDVMGIIVLSLLTGLKGGGSIWLTLLKAIGFFAFTVGIGYLLRQFFKWLVTKYPHKRRTGIFAIAMCLFYAYCAEKFFGIASITGAYMAGLCLSGLDDTGFVDRKVIVSGYMIFTPIFFASIGITANFAGFKFSDLGFAAAFVAVGIIGKILGCSGISKACGFNTRESLTIGCGMIARGEVALAVYAAGSGFICHNGIDPLVATVCLILVSSVLCPVLLKACFGAGHHPNSHDNHVKSRISSEAIDNAEHPEPENTAVL